MSKIKSIGIRKLKDNISSIIRETRNDTIYLITDRDEVVAQISRPNLVDLSGESGQILSQWLKDGVVSMPSAQAVYSMSSKPRLTMLDSKTLLDELRADSATSK